MMVISSHETVQGYEHGVKVEKGTQVFGHNDSHTWSRKLRSFAQSWGVLEAEWP
jgi:hypothetical protein